MKRITTFLIGAAAMSVLPMAARELTPQEAVQRAFASTKATGTRIKALSNETQLLYTAKSGDRAGVYVMAVPQTEGYVVLSADDVAVPVLGYADNGTFAADRMSPEFNYWLNEYAREIAWAAANNLPAASNTPTIKSADRAAILPMCSTRWNQDAPYNDNCPTDAGGKCVTGCVATAMAQVMKYYNWPPKGTGTFSYYWQNGSKYLSMDFENTTFDWANMTDSYNSASTAVQKSAVATLMNACGISVKMMYASSASGAYSSDVPNALKNYFNYAPSAVQLSRDNFGLHDWEDIVYNQLVDFGPVYYSGSTVERAGHAYVCDGYRTDGYFHFNWGWGGMSDGYFRLTALDPGSQGIGGSTSGFNYSQSIIAGVQKPDNARPFNMFYARNFNVSTLSTTLGSRVSFTGGYYNGGERVTGVSLGIVARNDSTGEEIFMPYYTNASLNSNAGYATMALVIPASLADGSYKVTPAYKLNDKVNRMYTGLGFPYLGMKVDGTLVTFIRPAQANLTNDKLEVLSNVIIGSRFMVDATFTNSSPTEFYNEVYPAILKKGTDNSYTVVSKSTAIRLDVPGNESLTMRYYQTCPSTLSAGEYYVCVLNTSNQVLGPVIPVTAKVVAEGISLQLKSLSIVNSSSVDKNNIEVNVSLNCLNGSYANTLYLGFQPENGGNPIDGIYTEMKFMEKGQTYTFTINGEFPMGVPGTKYLAALYAFSNDGTLTPIPNMRGRATFPFTLAEQSGIDSVEADDDNSPAEYFDLMGRKLNAEPESGLFIIRKGGKTTKVIK